MLQAVRETIRIAAPEAEERIGYRMSVFFLDRTLICFAAFKQRIGLYPPCATRRCTPNWRAMPV